MSGGLACFASHLVCVVGWCEIEFLVGPHYVWGARVHVCARVSVCVFECIGVYVCMHVFVSLHERVSMAEYM